MIENTEQFIEIWQAAASLDEVAQKMGEMGLTTNGASIRARASKLRARGVPLKRFTTTGKASPGPSLAVTHANEDPNWATPEWVLNAARELLDNIDLDPASDADANRDVQADRYFTVDDDGLKQRWDNDGYPSRVFLNPPGRWVPEFWEKLIAEWNANRVLTAFWVGFNVDHLRWLSTWTQHPLGFYWCVPRQRIKFVCRGPIKKQNPSCANYLVWLPDEDCNENWARFCEVMGKHGRCVRGSEGFYSGERHKKHGLLGVSHAARRVRSAVPSGRGSSSGANGSPE